MAPVSMTVQGARAQCEAVGQFDELKVMLHHRRMTRSFQFRVSFASVKLSVPVELANNALLVMFKGSNL